MSNRTYIGRLLATTVIAGLAAANPAFAQDTSNQPNTQTAPPTETSGPDPESPPADQIPTANTNTGEDAGDIVVTGTLLRRTNAETPSPVTVLSSESLAQRGINTASEAVQRVSSNNAGTIQSGWNTGFNFASGANAPALRGLTVQNTLSIFDGLRMAPYPLADDGQRNFVDLNSIPSAIIDRIEILRDGASSTYGADAIAGVVNVITKKEIRGLHLNGSYGVSQEGDAKEKRIDATYGFGDLQDRGFNFYIGAEYQKQDELWARDRGFPFNTQDLTSICGPAGPPDQCMFNGNWNGISTDGQYNGNISIPGVTWVRPQNGASTNGAGRFQFLNPQAGCRQFDTVNPVASPPNYPNQTLGTVPIVNGQFTSCEVNFTSDYLQLLPEIERYGVTARTTVNIADNHQLYAMGTYYRTNTAASFTPLGFNGTPVPPIPAVGLAAYNVMLPVYVCPTGQGTFTGLNTGCNASNGVLNPYNPFAANGQTAQAFVRSTRPRQVETHTRALRGVIGLSGTIFNDVRYSTDFVASGIRLDRIQKGYLIPQRIMDAVARGEINFMDLEATPENVWDYISPDSDVTSTSNLYQWTGTLSKDLFDLPGGSLGLAVGAQYRHEAIDAPSGNPPLNDANGLPDPTQNQYNRYYSLNAVSAKGSRNVKSAFFEIGAPFMDIATNGFGVEVLLSGRYDKYSTGQKNFSPKAGIKVTPIKELALRGTWSRGFRIPSFNEAFGLPTTGYVGQDFSSTCNDFAAFCAAHQNNAYATGPFNVGLTSFGDPNLDPEKSKSITAGLIFEPVRNISFTVDYFNIKVKDLIVGVTNIGPVLDAYYNCTLAQIQGGTCPIPAGYTVVTGAPDPANPDALPHIGFIQAPYRNADSQVVRGIDFGANIRWPFFEGSGIGWNTFFEASYLMKYQLIADGEKFNYEGTLSPCNVTSCSGAPKWRGSLQNTLDFGNTTLSATVYYTKGYDMASVDFGAVKGDCESAAANGSAPVYQDGTPVMCKSKDIWNVDVTASHKINDIFTIYANVLNVFNDDPPFDHGAAYGLFNFNPAWAGPNIVGRYFRLGLKVDLNPAEAVMEPVAAPVLPPPPPAAPATVTCPDGLVILAGQQCPAPPPPPPPPPPAPERGN